MYATYPPDLICKQLAGNWLALAWWPVGGGGGGRGVGATTGLARERGGETGQPGTTREPDRLHPAALSLSSSLTLYLSTNTFTTTLSPLWSCEKKSRKGK